MAAAPSNPPSPMDSTAVLGTSISAALLLETLVEDVHRPQVERGRVVLVRLGGLGKQVGDLDLGLAEDDPRLLLPRGLGLARHGVLQRLGDDHVAHLDRLDRDAPGIGPLVDELLELRLDLLAAAEEHGQRRAADDVAERVCAAQLTATL